MTSILQYYDHDVPRPLIALTDIVVKKENRRGDKRCGVTLPFIFQRYKN